jgi:hypothetical protein
MPILPTCSIQKAKKRSQKMPYRTPKDSANLQVQRFSRKTEIDFASQLGEETGLQ